MFSATLISGKSARSCQITWMPSARAVAGLSPSIGRPSNSIVAPGSGRWTPLTTLMSVLLPQPFSPARQMTSPRRTSKRTSSSASTPPKRLDTCSSRSSTSASGSGARFDEGRAVTFAPCARWVEGAPGARPGALERRDSTETAA